MEDSAKLTKNQLSFSSTLEADDPLAVQELSSHWPELTAKLDTWIKEIASTLAAKAAYLYLLDEKHQLLRPYFSWPVRTNKSYFTEREIGQGIAGLTAQSKHLVRLGKSKNSKSTEPGWPHQSTLAVPLMLDAAEQPVGVLVIADKLDQVTFSPQDEQVLLSLVNQSDAALIIKNANLIHRKRDPGQDLTTIGRISQTLNNSLHLMDVDSVCRAILQIPDLKDIFQFDVAEICLWNPQAKILTTALRMLDGSPDIQAYARTYHLNEGYTGWIAAQQKSLLIEDTHRYTGATPRAGLANFPYRAYLGVPLKIGAKLLGTLELVAAPIAAFDSRDATMLEIVANHAAVAIDYALLFQETQRNLSKLSLLFDASHELSSTLSYEELLVDLSSQMAEAFSADKCAVYNFDETSGILTLVQQYLKSNGENHSAPLDSEALPLTVSKFPALQAALKERSLLIVRLGDSESAPYETEWLKQQKCGVMVAIPLIGRDKVTGLVLLFSANPKAFTEDEIWLAQSLASQVNIAIENALLFNLTDQQLQTRVNELAGLQRVSGELNSTLDLNRILDIVLEEAIRVTEADFGNVNLYDTQTGNLVAHKEQNWPTTTAVDDTKFPAPTTAAVQGFMGRALKTGQAILVPDVSKEKDYLNVIDSTRSKVVVPIFYGGEPAGVINLESKHLNFFNNDQLRYLEALANQAAVALGNTQAYQEQKRERERANRRADQLARLSEISNAFRTNRPLPEILEDVAYAIVETVGYSVVLVSLVEGNPPVVRPKVGAGIPIAQLETLRREARQPLSNLQAIMREEFRLSNSYFIPVERMEVWQNKLDVPQVEDSRPPSYLLPENKGLALKAEGTKFDIWHPGDVLFIPLTDTEDNTIGLLTVANPDTDERPDILHVQTLEIFANHAAAAIENARLFELEQQRRRLADTLRGVAETISSQLEFEELLNIVLQELAKVINYDSASVQLLKEDQLVIIGGRGWEDSQQVIGTAFSMEGNNPNRRVIETQEPLIVGNAPLAYPEGFSEPPHNRIKSWLGVPLTYGINVLGLMAVESYSQYNFFTQEDAKVVLAFASQVAVALQNARLFEEARQQVRQLAALTEVAQSISRALNLNEVLNLVLDAVFDLAGQSKGSIWLIDRASHTVKIADTKNVPTFLVELFNKSAISVDSEPFASVIQSGQVLVIGGTSGKDDIAHYGLPFPNDVTYVPLKTEAGVIGILAIEVVIHNKNMLKLVTTLADLAAIAIDNARLLEDTRRRANEMQNLYRLGVEVSGLLDVRQVMDSIVNNALTLTDTQIGTILLWDEEAKSYLIDGSLNTEDAVAQLILNEAKESLEIEPSAEGEEPLWSRLTQQIIDTGQPVMLGTAPTTVSDTSVGGRMAGLVLSPANGHGKLALPLGVRAILGVPIQVQNEVSGAIFVCNLAARTFNDRDIQLLSFVANQAAVAVRNAQLVQRLNLMTEELERRVAQRTEELAQTLQDLTEERDRVNALYQITRELAASFDLDRVLVEALSLINRAVGISHGSILLLDHETGSLVYRAALGRDKPLPRGGHKTQYRPGYGLAGKVIETRQARIVPDLFMDPDWVSKQDTPDRRSALAVPLITGEDVLGVLLLFHPEVNYFTDDHLKLVIAAGAQVATAINNAELYRLITDQAQRLGVMLRTQAAEAAKNQAILKGITDGVLVLDAKRNIVLVNPKAIEILNIEAERLENQPIQQSLGQPGSDETPELPYLFYLQLLKALAALEAGESSAEFRVEAGNKVIMVTLAPVMLAPEEQPSLVAVLRDISREAEIDRIKNEFISTVSHELRTPMTSIKGYADLLVSGSTQVGELNPIQRRFVQVIQSNANRLTELVNDILEISRIETGRVKLELESLDISQLINEVAVSFEGQMVKKAMNLALDLSEKLPHVYADKARVTQILVNLIGNAWQYTPEGGHITVRAGAANHRYIQVDVEDTGIGIVEKDIQYVFDRFFRSERTEVQVVDGTGLGLSITKMFVEMLGGEIWLKSQLDVGTTFSFTLPIDVTQAEATFDETGTQTQPALLLVDDNVAVANLLKPQVERAGYQVIIATDEENALNLARQAQPALKVIILNLLLKNGHGFALLDRLQADKMSGDAIILLTSLGTDESGQDLAVEVIDYIGRPFSDASVLERVRWTLTLATGETQEIGPAGMQSLRNGRYQILVVAPNQSTVKWFKETLEAHGYKVQRAFNSQQALDIAAGDKPDLVLMDPQMPDVEGASLISQLRRIMAPKRLPVIGIVDQSVPKQEINDKIKMLGRENWTKMKHPFVTDVLVAEIVQMGGQAGVNEGEK